MSQGMMHPQSNDILKDLSHVCELSDVEKGDLEAAGLRPGLTFFVRWPEFHFHPATLKVPWFPSRSGTSPVEWRRDLRNDAKHHKLDLRFCIEALQLFSKALLCRGPGGSSCAGYGQAIKQVR